MGLFEQIASGTLKEDDRGETIFLFPLLFFVPSRGYIIPIREDVERLKENVRKFYMILTWAIIPVAVVPIAVLNRDGNNMVLFLLVAFGVGVIARLAFIRLFLWKLIRGYQRTTEKVGFLEAQQMQSDAFSKKTLRNLGLLLACLLGLGIGGLLMDDNTPAIVLLVLMGFAGLQLVYLARIKRRPPGTVPQEKVSDGTPEQ